MRFSRNRQGFTLIELIVVVVVIAVLAGIAIVGYQRVIGNTKDASVQATVASLGREVTSLGAFDNTIDEADVRSAGADLTAGWVLMGDEGELVTETETVAWALLDGAAGFAALSETGHAIYGCSAINVTFARIDKTDTSAADPLDALPCDEATYNPGTTTIAPSWPIVASGGNALISVSFDAQPGATSYEAACWTTAMTAANAVTATGATSPIVVTELQNYVNHTCQVTAVGATGDSLSGTDTAIPAGSPVTPSNPFPQPTPNGSTINVVPEADECVGCDPFTPTVPSDPNVDGLWDITSMYSTHAGSHRLFAVDRGAGVVVSVVDYGAWAPAAEAYSWLNDSNTGGVTFDEPTGLAYGAHPTRTTSSSVTSFSVLYLTDAGTGNIWMLEPSARRATLVGSGFDTPTGVTWAACTDINSGAPTTLMGATQCLYIADATGVLQMPLRISSGPINLALPVVSTAADSVSMSADAAVKVTAAATLLSSEGTDVVARSYTPATTSTVTGTAPAGSTVIPASVTGSTALVVFADSGDHSIKTYNPAAPSVVTTVAGTGAPGYVDAVGTAAAFNSPKGLHFHGNWPFVYVADTGNGLLRRVDLETGDTITLYGQHPFRVVLRDNFDRADGSALGVTHIGQRPWQKTEGTSLISGNRLSFGPCCTAADNTVLVEGYTADASVSAVVDRNAPPTVVARWQDTDNFLYVNYVSGTGYPTYCYIRLSQMSGGVATTLSTFVIRSAGSCGVADYTQSIGIRVFGDRAQILRNEVAMNDPVTVAIPDTVTRHGIWRNYYGWADDFAFTPLAVDIEQVTPQEIQNWDTTGTDVNVTMTPLPARDTIDADRYELLRDGTVIHSFDVAGPYSFTDTGRTPGVTYDYTIRLVDAYGHISAESPSRLIDVEDDPGTHISVADDFDRADSVEIDFTSTGNVRWQKALGTAQISGSGLRLAPGNSTTANAAIVESYSGDMTVQAVAVGDPHRTGSVVARWQDPENFLGVTFVSGIGYPTYCYVRLSEIVAGVATQLTTFSIRSAGSCGAADYAKPIGIRAFGNTAQIMFDGAAVSAPVATTISDQNTRHGVYAYTFNPQSFRDFSLTPLPIDETQVVPTGIHVWDTAATTVNVTMTPLPDKDTIDAAGYELLRDGVVIHTFAAPGPYSHSDTGRIPGQTYNYTTRLVDTYGHRSAESPARAVLVQDAPGAPTLISDDFNRADSAELGNTSVGNLPWQKVMGNTSVGTSSMRLGSNGASTDAAIVETYSGDVTVQATVTPSGGGGPGSVVARWQNENNFLRVFFVSGGGFPTYCGVRLSERVAGVETELAYHTIRSAGNCGTGDWAQPIGIRTFNGGAQILFNGVARTAPVATSVPNTATRHGVWAYSSNPQTYDNFSAIPLQIDTDQVTPPQVNIWDATSSTINVTMTPLPANDTIDTSGYELLRDGTVIHTFAAAGPYSYTDTGRAAGTTYNYTIRVVDVFGHRSTQSPARNILTSSNSGSPLTVTDTFTRANGNELGNTEVGNVPWQKAQGLSVISSNQMFIGAYAVYTPATALVETYTGNAVVTATGSASVVARWQNPDNYMLVTFANVGPSWGRRCNVQLYDVIAGGSTLLSTVQVSTGSCSATHYAIEHGVSLSGTQAQLMYNGVLTGTPVATNVSSAYTRHGVSSSNTLADSFSVVPN